jgi:pimeloyl-ACP methyl ester carboxylesterase
VGEDRSILDRAGRAPDRTLSYGPHPDQLLDVYDAVIPVQGGAPVVVVLHGGFWRPAIDRLHTRAQTEALRGARAVVAMEFRRIPGDPDATVDDVRAGLEAVNHLSGAGRDMVVVGHSAGGHLALWAASQEYAGVRGVIALAPVADLRLARDLGLGDDAVADFLGEDRPDLDPMQLPPPRVPITIVHGTADEVVPIALAYSYVEIHPEARVVALEGVGHFALIDPTQDAFAVVVSQLEGMIAV